MYMHSFTSSSVPLVLVFGLGLFRYKEENKQKIVQKQAQYNFPSFSLPPPQKIHPTQGNSNLAILRQESGEKRARPPCIPISFFIRACVRLRFVSLFHHWVREGDIALLCQL